ncbi:MAG: methylated-DNA--[protein]-cysteine S-methyltransferase [Alphaproteobacteria bacterium]|nr:methylated-DNA--[protein]-cysteine S-methyltransferase [Alphaproteobacteria bacterium]
MTDKGAICRIGFLRNGAAEDVVAEWQAEWSRTAFVRGPALKDFACCPVAMMGTAFQHKVWREMAKIPSGSVRSYGEIARRIGNPKAARAVGAACGANPVPYIVPCHRVVAANGGLGGFSGGLDIKKKLLRVEGAR